MKKKIRIKIGRKKANILRSEKWLRMILEDDLHIIQLRFFFQWLTLGVKYSKFDTDEPDSNWSAEIATHFKRREIADNCFEWFRKLSKSKCISEYGIIDKKIIKHGKENPYN